MSQPVAGATSHVRPGARRAFGGRGWSVLLLASVTATLTGPGQTIGVSVFIDDLVADLGLSRSAVSSAYLIGTLAGAAALPAIGRLVDRRGVRLAQVLIGLAFGVALVNMSLVNGLIWLAIGFAGIRFLGQGALSLVATVTVSLAYERSRGTALGVFSTLSSGLMALVPVGLAVVIAGVGWRATWLVAAGVVVLSVVPIAWFGMRSLPTTSVRAEDATPGSSVASVERNAALRTRGFWIVALFSSTASMLGTALNFHQIDLLGEAGLSEQAAAALFIPQVLGSTVAGLAFGALSDRVGTRFLPAVGMGLLVAAHLLAAVVQPGAVVLVYAVTLGAMGGAVRTVAATLLPALFGTGHLGAIQGSLVFLNVVASALGPVTLAVAEAATGSYGPAALVLSALPAAVMVVSLAPVRPRPVSSPSGPPPS